MTTQEPTSTTQPPPQQKSSGNTVLTVVLVLIGAAAVLVIGVLLGRLIGGTGSSDAPAVNPPPPPPNTPYLAANDYVNVRSGPGTQYPVYGVIAPKATAQVIGKSSDEGWWVITIPTTVSSDGRGWVSAFYTTAYNTQDVPVVEAPPLPPEVEIPPVDKDKAYCTTNEVVNVRSGPGTQYPSYGLAQSGVSGQVIGVSPDGEWWVVSIPTSIIGEGQAWVSADYCEGKNTDGVPVVEPPPLP